jgi:hypothetical protein
MDKVKQKQSGSEGLSVPVKDVGEPSQPVYLFITNLTK